METKQMINQSLRRKLDKYVGKLFQYTRYDDKVQLYLILSYELVEGKPYFREMYIGSDEKPAITLTEADMLINQLKVSTRYRLHE